MTHQDRCCAAARQPPARGLAQLVAQFAHGSRAVNEQYNLTTVVGECTVDDANQTIVIEIVGHGLHRGEQRWLVPLMTN